MYMRKKASTLDIWPGFVDILSTVLMVVIFVLMTFMVSQLFLTEAINDRDVTVTRLNTEVEMLFQKLRQEKLNQEDLEKSTRALQSKMAETGEALKTVHQSFESEKVAHHQEFERANNLTLQLKELQEAIQHLNEAIKTEEEKSQTRESHFNQSLSEAQQTINKKEVELTDFQKQLAVLTEELTKLKEKAKANQENLGQFRSDFMAKLAAIIGDRSDIRIVGDRFIFQSEVLFEKGSADLGEKGRIQLDKLINALKDIGEKIPTSVPWILRVDGHTDHLPIKTAFFPSNWELSTARALSVVKYIVSQGIDPRHLVAAGFGEFQPLETSLNETVIARNRRIEFKLDQR